MASNLESCHPFGIAHDYGCCTFSPFSAQWYDDLSRLVRSTGYGTNDGNDLTDYDPGTAGSQTYEQCRINGKPDPNSSDAVIVAEQVYDPNTGRMTQTIDNLGRITLRTFDDLDRAIQVREDSGGINRITEYSFDTKARS